MDNNTPNPTYQPYQPVAPPMPSKKGSSGKAKWLIIFLALLFVAAGALAFWQTRQVNKLQSDKDRLEDQVAELQTSNIEQVDQTSEEPSDNSTSTQSSNQASATVLSTGQIRYVESGADLKLAFDCYVQPGKLTEVWARYGKSADNLKDSPKYTSELGMGEAGTLTPYSVVIQASELEPGTNYFYQCAGTQDGKTVYSLVAAFTSQK